jgi:polyhydroxybutyrate depolymerase
VPLAARPQICIVVFGHIRLPKGDPQHEPSRSWHILVVQLTARGRTFLALALGAGFLAGAAGIMLGLACLSSPAVAAAGRVTIVSGGSPRTAILIQHRRLKKGRRPAIIVLRAVRKQGPRLHRGLGLGEMARTSGAVLVYPEPLSGHWADAAGPEANRDMRFVRDLIAKLVSHGIANPNKLFLVGVGGGGTLALRLACDGKPKFAGVAILASSLPSTLEATCLPPGPVPLLMISGPSDALVANSDGNENLPPDKADLLSVEKTLGLFGKAAGCAGGVTSTVFPDKDIHNGARAYLDKLSNCAVPVEAIRIEGGGHMPAGIQSEAGTGVSLTNGDVNSAKLVWEFFRPFGG